MEEKIKKIILRQFILYGILLIFIIFPFEFVNALSLKTFIVEKVGSDKILISDGYSEYIIEHNYDCSDWDFTEGGTIYIDTYYSPMYGDEIIISGYTDKVCEVTDSDDVKIKEYYVEDVFDSEDKIIVSDSSGNKYLVEYGIGCGLSMWRYEDKKIDIDIGGTFLDGIGDTIYLLDSGKDCKVWDAEDLSTSSTGGYSPPSLNLCDLINCPPNSTCLNGVCSCNEGYVANGNVCITYTQNCQNQYGTNSYGDKNYCYCNTGYEWNSSKTSCIKSILCPLNSTKINNTCVCDSGYEWNYSQTACVKNIICPLNSTKTGNNCVCNEGYLMKNNKCITFVEDCEERFGSNVYGLGDSNNSCYCESGYEWNESKTACIKKVESKNEVVKEENTNTNNSSEIAVNKPEKKGFVNSASIFLESISNALKNFFSKIFH